MSRYFFYTVLSIFLFVGLAGCGTNEKEDSGSNDNDFQVGFSNFSEDDYKKQFEEVGPPESEFGTTKGPVRFLVGGVGVTFDSPSIRLHALLPPLPNISQEGAGGGVFYWSSPTMVSLDNVEVRLEDGTTYKNGEGLETARVNQVATAPPNPGRLPLDVPGDAERYINVHMPHRLTEDGDLGLAFENIQTLAGDLVITMPIGLTEHRLSLDGENRIEHDSVEVSVRREDETYRFSFKEEDRVHALQAIDADGNPVGLHSASPAGGDADWEVSWRQDQPDAVRVMIADSYTDRTVSYEVPANLDRVQIEPSDDGEDVSLSTGATLTVDAFKVEDGATEIEWSPSDLPVVELLGNARDGDDTEVKSAGVTGPGNARIRAEVNGVNLYYRTEADRVSGW